jgi:hypothetical protein
LKEEKMKSSGKWIPLLVFASLVLCSLPIRAQSVEPENIPQDVQAAVESGHFAETYKLDGRMNPFYLRGDFDGDGKPDYALWIKAKAGGATGIAIWLSSRQKFIILGAGVPFRFAGSTESNFEDLNVWRVYGKRPVEQGVEAGPPPRLIGEAILVGRSESGSGLIYWDGKSFMWYQQGD